MKILIADDEAVSRRLLQATLTKWQYDVTVARDGHEAWCVLQAPNAPSLLILDWQMPGLDGLEICRRLRERPEGQIAHILLLTSRGTKEDVVHGLEAGADDYLTKPFDEDELRARVQVGSRVVQLQMALAERVRDLEGALQQVKHLHGLLPICCYCKRIRDDGNYWHQVETYIAEHAAVRFSHGICPECASHASRDLGLDAAKA